MSIAIIVLLMLATLTLVVVGIGVLVSESDRRTSLVFSLAPDRPSRFHTFRAWLERSVLRTDIGRWLRRQMTNADLNWPIAETVMVAGLVLIIEVYVTYRLGGPVFMVILVALTLQGVRTWFQRREEARFAKFVDQLPDLARLLGNAAAAGLSLRASLSVAAQESQEPTRTELARVTQELNYGASLDDALERMGQRLPSRELTVLVNVLIIQTRAGGRIVSALRGITEALEIRRDLRREVATLTAGSRATVLAVSFLGGLMVLLVHNSVDGGLRALLANPIGLGIFIVSLGLFILGIVMVRRAVKVEI